MGLVLDPDVLKEFLDLPASQAEWFISKAWAEVSDALDDDAAVSYDEYQVFVKAFAALRAGLATWTSLRDPATAERGWGDVPNSMRAAGAGAYYNGIVKIVDAAEALDGKLDPATKQTLRSFCSVLWEYAECFALEIEASHDQVGISDLLDRLDRGLVSPWKPPLTPRNIGDYTKIGVSRLPKAPDRPDFFGGEPDINDPKWDGEGDGGDPGGGDGGDPGGGSSGDPGGGDGGGADGR
jgi:hypothetical protein